MRNKILIIIAIVLSALCKAETDKSKQYFTSKSEPYSYIDVDKIPKFNYEELNVVDYISKNLNIPDSIKSTGQALIYMTITKTGEISNVRIPINSHKNYDKEIRHVINSMPKWIPGLLDNKPVDVIIFFEIRY